MQAWTILWPLSEREFPLSSKGGFVHEPPQARPETVMCGELRGGERVELRVGRFKSTIEPRGTVTTATSMITSVQCSCRGVEVQISGKAILQYVCHCDDCQAVHGKAFSCGLYAASAVSILRGETEVFTLRTTPRTRCKRCRTYLFAEVPGYPVRGINADLLPEGMFRPEFHSQCRYAAAPIRDELPHYRGTPARFGGSDELMEW